MTVKVKGKTTGIPLEVKRFYLEGITIHDTCPKCSAPFVRDLGTDYLSYPVIGEPQNVYGYCKVENCGHEWDIEVVLEIKVRPVKPGE